eukprot:scaffold2816_cov121-Cylindrotheca_fusiformis.AAC.25
MGFLKKIFKKKKKKTSDAVAQEKTGKKQWKTGKKQNVVKNETRTSVPSHAPRKSLTSPSSPRPFASSTPSLPNQGGQQDAEMEPGRIIPRNRNDYNSEKPPVNSRNSGADDENVGGSNASSNGLSRQQLQQLEHSEGRKQQNTNQYASHQPMFRMTAETPKQQMMAMDDMNRSYGSSSSFNLSTDAEDSDYENLRSRGVLPGSLYSLSALDMSSSVASNSASHTDHETVFPALDDLTMPSNASRDFSRSSLDPSRNQQEEMARKLGLMPPPPPPRAPTPEEEPGYIPSPDKKKRDSGEWAISPSTQASNDPASIRGVDSNQSSWAISPSTDASNEPRSARSSNSNPQPFSFEQSQPSALGRSRSTPTKSYASSRGQIRSEDSRNPQGLASRSFTSPQSHTSSSTEGYGNHLGDFADFGNYHSWEEDRADLKPAAKPRTEADRPYNRYQQSPSTTSPPKHQERSLSELLALAKKKNRNNAATPTTPGRSRQGRVSSGSSVNSAPAYSSAYLRQYHNSGKYSKAGHDRESSTKPMSPRLSNDDKSVSDIIQSLEVSNQMRRGSGTANLNHSAGDTGSASITRLARERLRERRRKEYEYNNGASDESDNSENQASESWLFDGVTGALGPRGISADLESLSGRSNRSKNSHGNKSHRSRQSRSRMGSSRKPRSSNESVGSRESRHSRGSKTSRYSHRSTKSYISQMSEQSRSVANDLLRLEMQLAMVGQENRDDLPVQNSNVAGGASTVGGGSRHRSTRKSYSSSQRSTGSAASKRSKVTIIAPPGKLGIILANKADSKGTVVSGVRNSSALVDKISPGDRIIGIDGEDVSRMTVSEITVIMSRKADYDRNLTVLTLPKYLGRNDVTRSQVEPNGESQTQSHHSSYDNSYQQYRG